MRVDGNQENVPGVLILSPQEGEQIFTSSLQKFDVANHVLGSQHIVDQHEASQHLRHRCLLRRVYNPSMGDPGCMQPKKVRILRPPRGLLEPLVAGAVDPQPPATPILAPSPHRRRACVTPR